MCKGNGVLPSINHYVYTMHNQIVYNYALCPCQTSKPHVCKHCNGNGFEPVDKDLPPGWTCIVSRETPCTKCR
jgi:hypothetical protein